VQNNLRLDLVEHWRMQGMRFSLSTTSDGFLGRSYHNLISAGEGLPDLMVPCLNTLPALIVSCLSTLPAFIVSCLSMAVVLTGCDSLLLKQHLHTSAIRFVNNQVRLKLLQVSPTARTQRFCSSLCLARGSLLID